MCIRDRVGVGAGQLVGDGGAVFAGGLGGGVEGVLGPGVGQVGVAVGGHDKISLSAPLLPPINT